MRVAVIGVGSMGKNHVRVLSGMEGVELVAVSDKNKGALQMIEKKHKIRTYEDYKEMLESEQLDMACIAVPTEYHKEVAVACCEKKINVLLEKPIASNVEEARQIIEAAKRNDVLLTIGHLERFNPAVKELKQRLVNNELGAVYKIEADRLGPYPRGRIKDAGVVIDLAVHDLDIFNYLMNSKVVRINAESEKRIHSTDEDLLLALLRFENNVLGIVNVNWLTPIKRRKLRILGEKGMFEVDYIDQTLHYYENSSKHRIDSQDFSISEGQMVKFFIQKREPLLAELEHFIECVRSKQQPIVSGEDGLKALELAEHIIDSANKQEVLRLE